MKRRDYIEYYEMCEEQFEEMEEFYEKLGYDKKQVKKLCKQCFGAEIRVSKYASYQSGWVFYRKREYKRREKFAKAGGRACAVEDGLCAEPPMMEAEMPGMAMMSNAMMGGAMPGAGMSGMMGMAAAMPVPLARAMAMSEPPEFNTAETNNAPENEEHSPLDEAQVIFSANVNTASWSYLRNKIKRKKSIDPAFVRIEEIVNSYQYELDAPQNDDLFSVSTELGSCPWNGKKELMFLGFKGRKAQKECRQNLALLVDVSGSMDDEWILTQMSIAAILSKLKKGDIVSIITYSDETETVAKGLDGGDRSKCIEAVLDIDGIGGCTNGSDGLEKAYKYISKHYDEDANNRVFIFTDGDFNFGITGVGALEKFIKEKRETGIYLSIVGYGERNLKDNKMEGLARNGNGNYTFIGSPYDILDYLWEKLVSSLVTVAKNVKISVEFNPAFVSEYRLIGYDARVLTQQEFHDTEKAVDGIGSEHNVVALVELKRGKAEQKYKSRYVNVDVTANDSEFAFVEVHYQSPEGENLVLTKSIMLSDIEHSDRNNVDTAAVLAAFGLLVKDSEYKGSMTGKELYELMKDRGLRPESKEKEKDYTHFGIIESYLESIL